MQETENNKPCKRCGKAAPEVEFHKKKLLCVDCERIHGREYYKKKKRREKMCERKRAERRTPEGMLKAEAHRTVKLAIKEGKVERPLVCSVCHADGPAQAHHDSYEKKDHLKVRWVCKKCHARLDNERRDREKVREKVVELA